MSALATQIIRDAATLAALSPEWWDLWRRSSEATPFQSPAWLMPWWDVFAPGQLSCVTVRHGRKLVAFAPLYLETGPLGLRLLPLGIGISDYCDLLIDPDYEDDASAVLMRELMRLAPWEICEFTELASNAAALRLGAPPSLKTTMSDASSAPVLTLPESVVDLERVVPRLRLRQLKHARKAAAKRGEVAIVVGDEDNSEGLLNDLIRLHSARWNGRGDGVFADKRVAEFHAAALPGLIAANLARLYGLMIGDVIAAVYYGFVDRGRAYAYLQGFDTKFERESPGLIVVGYAIEQAVKEGAREFHFLRGDEAYKYEWGASPRRNRLKQFVRDSAIVPG